MIVLGLHIGHDAAACVVVNGKLKYAISEERITRIKNHTGYPYQAVKQVLSDENISRSDVDIIAIGGHQLIQQTQAYSDIYFRKKKEHIKDVSNEHDWDLRLVFLKNRLKEWRGVNRERARHKVLSFFKDQGFANAKVHFYDHHLAHAASAYYDSGYSDSLILTQDGGGDGLYGGIYRGSNGQISTLHENKYSKGSTVSLANIYAAVTKIVGFKRNRHEGKITGLAAYGKRYLEVFDNLIELQGLSFKDKQDFRHGLIRSAYNMLVLGRPFENPMFRYLKENLAQESKEDIAYTIQKLCETCIVDLVRNAHGMQAFDRVCLAGGLFANVRINQLIEELPFVKEVFIFPNMGDGGLSVGAAYLASQEAGVDIVQREDKSVYLGFGDDKTRLESVLESYGDLIEYRRVEHDYEREIAQLIADNKVVGYFSGRMEFGPRALCHRSMLINASDSSVNDSVNKRLRRTEFMPFAPVILEEDLSEYFCDIEGKKRAMNYMTITALVREEKRHLVPAVVHVDGTARPQIINDENNKKVCNILRAYRGVTGVPLFVNTSFNVHEEPIVCTYEDAIKSMLNNCVDVICFDEWFVWPNA